MKPEKTFRTQLVCTCLLFATVALAGNGSIQGRVVDTQTGEGLPMANVVVSNTELGAAAALDGYFRIGDVAEGNHCVIASMLGYADATVTDVEVQKDAVARVDFALSPKVIKMKTVAVTAERARSTVAGLLSSQRRAPVISSGISAEQISMTSDSRASDVLKRVTGLSVVDDKYVFVRGLSERYSKVTLNNSELPSPEPDKRVVPFDIFPSGLLDDVVITKTFMPNLPGDFAGGAIQLSTKEFPERMVGRFSTSYGCNSQTTFRDFQTYAGGSVDFLGFDDGTRAMPGDVERASRARKLIEGGLFGGGFSEAELEAFGESFHNIWNPTTAKAPINQSHSLSFGNQFHINDRPVGYLAAINYKNDYSFKEDERFYYITGAGGQMEARHHYQEVKVSNFDVLWGGIFNASYKPSPRDKLGIKFTYTRSADDEVMTYGMYPNRDHNLDERVTRLQWVERSLLSSGLSGDHQFAWLDSRLGWHANYALATREEPDTREVLYEAEVGTGNYRLADESNSGSRFFSHLVDHSGDVGLNWDTPFKQWSSLPAKLELGVDAVYKDRRIDSRRFRFKPQDFNDVNIYQDAEAVFSPENIRPDGFQLDEDTRPTDNYSGTHFTGAGYAMVDMPLANRLRLAGGARIENSNQKVTTFDLFNPDADPVVGSVNETDLLPSANLIYQLNPDMNLRAGIAQTVSRPSFRELSKFDFTDIGGHAVVGNPALERARIMNYDLRWEWYPTPQENVSFALFYKYFDKPIEQTLLNATELTTSWQNAKSAVNYRAEMELRTTLDHLWRLLSPFNVTANLAVIKSRVQLNPGGSETTKDRPLQGQSPYVVNLSLEYQSSDIGLQVTGMYNVSGRRIIEVGIAGTPDIYEEPFHKLDFTIHKSLWRKLNAKLAGSNLLDPEVEFTQGDQTQRHYRRGRSFSLGLSYAL